MVQNYLFLKTTQNIWLYELDIFKEERKVNATNTDNLYMNTHWTNSGFLLHKKLFKMRAKPNSEISVHISPWELLRNQFLIWGSLWPPNRQHQTCSTLLSQGPTAKHLHLRTSTEYNLELVFTHKISKNWLKKRAIFIENLFWAMLPSNFIAKCTSNFVHMKLNIPRTINKNIKTKKNIFLNELCQDCGELNLLNRIPLSRTPQRVTNWYIL